MNMTSIHPTTSVDTIAPCLYLQKWGWVQEMYAFTIALYNAGIKVRGACDRYPNTLDLTMWHAIPINLQG